MYTIRCSVGTIPFITIRQFLRPASNAPPTFADFRSTMRNLLPPILLAGCTGLLGCTQPADEQAPVQQYTMDNHSNARPNEAVITHLDLDVSVDMDRQRISGVATYDLRVQVGGMVRFDTDGLEIIAVHDGQGQALEFSLGDSTMLGRPLEVTLPDGVERVAITYRTGKDAKALQWLAPAQTMGRAHPFLFTQGQAILTRTWIPIQDSPGIRFTYTAKVRVPEGLMALMSASNSTERSADGQYAFRMDQPIPAYLMALAVGELEFRPLGERCGVYAEPGLVDKAAWEFADTEAMLKAAEELYGPYRWERYDVLVLPPSFPFGGMENPRLTFATPTIIAGDRSLTALVAHELAHSWSGNLVTNATWNDFWLNEGFTVYFEKRICEQVYGKEYAAMLDLLGYQDLLGTEAKLHKEGNEADTRLRLDLTGRNPDDGVTDIAYEKGYSFLRMLEEKVGRAKFDDFLRRYFDTFAFQSMTTDRFLEHLDRELIAPNGLKVDLDTWVNGTGIPTDIVVPVSDRFVKVEAEIAKWQDGTPADQLNASAWTTFEWMHFLRHLPNELGPSRMKELDNAFGFTNSGNAEILVIWLQHCIRNGHEAAYPRLDQFLSSVGRRKFLVPLYEELARTDKGLILAQTIYRNARSNYHSVTIRTLDKLLDWEQVSKMTI